MVPNAGSILATHVVEGGGVGTGDARVTRRPGAPVQSRPPAADRLARGHRHVPSGPLPAPPQLHAGVGADAPSGGTLSLRESWGLGLDRVTPHSVWRGHFLEALDTLAFYQPC